MATIVYKNAKLFIDDTELDAQLADFSVNYKAEMLDATTFGNDTRIHKGGLFLADMAGKGYANTTNNPDIVGLLWAVNGLDEGSSASGLPVVVTVFADGITEGTVTDMGFAMKGVVETLTFGGGVGILLPVNFAVQSRGVY